MGILSRAGGNVWHRRRRALGAAIAVGLLLATFLVLSEVDAGVSAYVERAEASVQDLITIAAASPATLPSDHLNASILPIVARTPEVASVQRVLVELPGLTAAATGGRGNVSNGTVYEGVDTTATITTIGGLVGASSVVLTDGRLLNSTDEDRNVSMVGAGYAAAYGVGPGSTIRVNGSALMVVGIFSTGTRFGNRTVILPYPAAQAAFASPGPNYLDVQVGEPGEVSGVVNELRSELGPGYVVSAPGQGLAKGYTAVIDGLLSGSEIGSWVVLAVGCAVMVVGMAWVSSARAREIAVLKTLGFGNGTISLQLAVEGIVLSFLGVPIGILASLGLGRYVAGPAAIATAANGRGGFAGRLVGSVSFLPSPELLLIAVAVAAVFGIVGSLSPILRAIRLRPAEAFRND